MSFWTIYWNLPFYHVFSLNITKNPHSTENTKWKIEDLSPLERESNQNRGRTQNEKWGEVAGSSQWPSRVPHVPFPPPFSKISCKVVFVFLPPPLVQSPSLPLLWGLFTGRHNASPWPLPQPYPSAVFRGHVYRPASWFVWVWVVFVCLNRMR